MNTIIIILSIVFGFIFGFVVCTYLVSRTIPRAGEILFDPTPDDAGTAAIMLNTDVNTLKTYKSIYLRVRKNN